jgi:hypothetical protein
VTKKDKLKNEIKNELKLEYQKSIEELRNYLEKNLNSNFEKKIKELQDNLELSLKYNIKQYLVPNNNTKNYISNTKVCMCAIGKKENPYAKEFVNHYINLGYNQIYIYDNNDPNDEKFEDVLKKEISYNLVNIINYRGYRGKANKPQFDAYQDCYDKYSGICDWISFYDFDEFLVLKDHETIQEFLDQEKFSECINVKINWLTYSDNELIHYEDKPVQERFTTSLPKDNENRHIKSTVRGHLKSNYWSKLWNPHSSLGNFTSCIPTGEKTDANSPFHTPWNFEGAYIKHYVTKSLEEYLGKIRRGRSDLKVTINNKYWKKKFKFYFERNKKTKEKLDYIKKELNITIT